MPIVLPNLWALTVRRPKVQSNTMVDDLRAIAHLYDWASRRSIDLDDRLASGNGLQPGEMRALLQNARYERPTGRQLFNQRLVDVKDVRLISASTHCARVAIIRNFLVWALERLLYRLDVRDLRQQGIRERVKLIERQAKEFMVTSASGFSGPLGLSFELQVELLRVVHPGYNRNPFHRAVRYRNWIIIVLMLTFGFRRGEVLKIYVTDVNVRGRTPTLRIARRPGDGNDPRAVEPSVKTLGREVPLHPTLAALLDAFIRIHRSKFPNHEDSVFLLLSKKGEPLSLRMVNYIFEQIAKRFSVFDGLLRPHVMRHTYNDMLSRTARENGLENSAFKAAQNYLNGWDLTSDQGVRYSQRDIEANAAQISLRHQERLFA